jgi:methylglutaconyl-CoA hydratase
MTTSRSTLRTHVDATGIARVTLARPDVRNAMNRALIDELAAAIGELNADPSVRGIVLDGEGPVFCAGADLNWLRSVQGATESEVEADSRRLQELYRALDESPKATLCRVHGGAYAGALGLVSACDVAIAAADAKFSVSEVRMGIIPAVLSMVLMPRIGPGWFRYLAVTGGMFDAEAALRAGLVHEIASDESDLDARVAGHVSRMLAAAPGAVAACKALVPIVAGADREAARQATLRHNVVARFSAEGQEGMAAFLEKRKPAWNPG